MIKININLDKEVERIIHLDGEIYYIMNNTNFSDEIIERKGGYDVLFLLTGEDEKHRTRSEKAIKLFNKGNVGSIFVSGGYDGFETNPNKEPSATTIADYLNSKGKIPSNKIFLDNRSLDTIGSFAYPFADPLEKNEFIKDVNSILLVTEKNHLERAIENSLKVISPYHLFYAASKGNYNPGILIKTYESAIRMALRDIKYPSSKKVLKFLKEKHPFYQEGWFDKSITERKYEVGKSIVKWLAGYNKAD